VPEFTHSAAVSIALQVHLTLIKNICFRSFVRWLLHALSIILVIASAYFLYYIRSLVYGQSQDIPMDSLKNHFGWVFITMDTS